MSDFPELRGSKVLLRKPKKEDIDARISFGSSIEFVRMCGGDTRNVNEFTLDEGMEWYDKILAHPCKWVIEYGGVCIGEAGLTPYQQDNKARYSIGIFDSVKINLGIGTEVTKLVLDYAFNSKGYHKVYLRVLEYNKRAIRCYEKCGFIREGIDREGAFIEGCYETDIYMGILADEHRFWRSSGMDIIQASETHIEGVLSLSKYCTQNMASNLIDQWDDIYPNREIFLDDIRNKSLYIVLAKDSEEVIACIALNEYQDPEYKEICWRYEGERIGVIHRLMVHPKHEGKGIAKRLVGYVENIAKNRQYDALRLDIFVKNPRAVGFYKKLGYEVTGQVIFRKGEFFCCEKLI